MEIEIVDRYTAAGIPHPDPKTVCKGQCEGMGCVPVYVTERNKLLKRLWNEAEKESPTDDGWHFVICPDCDGTGVRHQAR